MKRKYIITKTPFKSFFQGGFECAYPIDNRKVRIDLLKETKHDIYCREDYQRLKSLGIYTVREGLSWSIINKEKNTYDFSRFENMMKIAQEEGIQQIWDLNHFDFPERLDVFSEEFINDFANYSKEAISLIRKYQKGTIYIVPINEISFFSFIGADVGYWAPHIINKGGEFKDQLVKAAIAAMNSMWEVDKDVQFIHVDPIMRRAAKKNASESVKKTAEYFNEIKFHAWDMISGKLNPHFGGDPKYLNIVGLNYYFFNQEWVLEDKDETGRHRYRGIGWNTPNRISLADLIEEVYQRYKKPIMISETGGWGDDRWMWWVRTLNEIDDAKQRGIPILGVCAYPVVDRPDWNNWVLTNSGLWDFECDDPECRRIPHQKTIRIIKKYIENLKV